VHDAIKQGGTGVVLFWREIRRQNATRHLLWRCISSSDIVGRRRLTSGSSTVAVELLNLRSGGSSVTGDTLKISMHNVEIFGAKNILESLKKRLLHLPGLIYLSASFSLLAGNI